MILIFFFHYSRYIVLLFSDNERKMERDEGSVTFGRSNVPFIEQLLYGPAFRLSRLFF